MKYLEMPDKALSTFNKAVDNWWAFFFSFFQRDFLCGQKAIKEDIIAIGFLSFGVFIGLANFAM